MKSGSVVLAPLPQQDGRVKNRPAIVLCRMPPFGDCLLCGVSTQLQQAVAGFDEIVEFSDADYAASGLKTRSLIRLGFLAVFPANALLGSIGEISSERLRRLRERLAAYLLREGDFPS